MRDQCVRLVFLGLILGLPMLIASVGDPPESGHRDQPTRASLGPRGISPVQGIQAVLVTGLTLAGRESQRLRERRGNRVAG